MMFLCWDCNFSIKDGEEDESSQRCMTLGYVTSAVPTFFSALTRFTQNLIFQGRRGLLRDASQQQTESNGQHNGHMIVVIRKKCFHRTLEVTNGLKIQRQIT